MILLHLIDYVLPNRLITVQTSLANLLLSFFINKKWHCVSGNCNKYLIPWLMRMSIRGFSVNLTGKVSYS